jgi:DNA-binding beta-propeller fold protein YncE
MVYFDTSNINGTGGALFHKLDIAANSMTNLGSLESSGSSDKFDRVLLSPDGSKVYSAVCGSACVSFWLDTSNDAITTSYAEGSEDFPDLAVSGDGGTVDVASAFTDLLLNTETATVYIDWETWFPLAANEAKAQAWNCSVQSACQKPMRL